MSRMEHHEQDNKQIFPRSARTSCSHGYGQSRSVLEPLVCDPVDFCEDRLCAANTERMGQEGRG